MSEIIFTYLVTSISKLITLECVTPVRQTTRNNVSPSFYVSIRWSTYRMSQECKIDTSFDLSSHFFLNWLFSWEFRKEVFSQNWNEEWNKEIHRSKKISPFKTQVILFSNLKNIIESGEASVMLSLFFMYLKESN